MHRKKKRTTVNLPKKLLKRAKAEGLNLSKTLENALKAKLQGDSFSVNAFSEKGSEWARRGSNPRHPPRKAKRFLEKNVCEKTPEEFLEEFEKTCRIAWGLSDGTVKNKLRCARRLIDFLGGHPLTAMKSDILDFLEKYDVQGSFKGVRVIYGRYFDTNLASDIKIPQSEPKPKEIPEKDRLIETFHNIDNLEFKTAFLMLASSGLRRGELMSLDSEHIDREKRMILSPKRNTTTKSSWVSFYNQEAEEYLERLGYLPNRYNPDSYTRSFNRASDHQIQPQVLRQWFAEQMGKLGVSDRYIDAFCGRTPKSVLAKHYSDYSPRKLREVYEDAGISVLR